MEADSATTASDADLRFSEAEAMARALRLAESARGYVEPNPMVGAVLLDGDGRLIAEGHHGRFGGPHAEAAALSGAGNRAAGQTLLVTLEPCAHYGKQPPCADAVIAAGVSRVVAAMRDPFPEVAGRGFQKLREAGIDVQVGLMRTEAEELNGPFLKRVRTGLPYVHAKWAMTLDGKTATHTGHSLWISGEESRREVHTLRGRMDAIVAGGRTVALDDARLTARPPGPRTPLRVVLASRSHPLTQEQTIVQTAAETPVLLMHSKGEAVPHRDALAAAGVELQAIDDVRDVASILRVLGERGCTNVLVEGGATIHDAFRRATAIDETHVFIAPKLIGGGHPAVAGSVAADTGLPQIPTGPTVLTRDVRRTGGDVYVRGIIPQAWRLGSATAGYESE